MSWPALIPLGLASSVFPAGDPKTWGTRWDEKKGERILLFHDVEEEDIKKKTRNGYVDTDQVRSFGRSPGRCDGIRCLQLYEMVATRCKAKHKLIIMDAYARRILGLPAWPCCLTLLCSAQV